MKNLKLFDKKSDAIFNNKLDRVYKSPGVSLVKESNDVIYADFKDGDYYLDNELNPKEFNGYIHTIGSYNIRYWNGPSDPDNLGFRSWEYRKDKVFEMIRLHNFDICGLQEVTPQMIPDIISNLTEYTYIGYGRLTGESNSDTLYDEQVGILYKSDRYLVINQGRYFLSDTPDVVSKLPGATLNRLVTWIRLKDKVTNNEFYVLSTHLDHHISNQSDTVRDQQAMILNSLSFMNDNLPIFIVGDFNCEPTSNTYSILTSVNNDSYKDHEMTEGYVCNLNQVNSPNCPGCSNLGNTYTGLYSSSDLNPKHIDYVFYNNAKLLSYSIDNNSLGLEYYPSDHLPVITKFRLN